MTPPHPHYEQSSMIDQDHKSSKRKSLGGGHHLTVLDSHVVVPNSNQNKRYAQF